MLEVCLVLGCDLVLQRLDFGLEGPDDLILGGFLLESLFQDPELLGQGRVQLLHWGGGHCGLLGHSLDWDNFRLGRGQCNLFQDLDFWLLIKV